jgi:hypothetical protein
MTNFSSSGTAAAVAAPITVVTRKTAMKRRYGRAYRRILRAVPLASRWRVTLRSRENDREAKYPPEWPPIDTGYNLPLVVTVAARRDPRNAGRGVFLPPYARTSL